LVATQHHMSMFIICCLAESISSDTPLPWMQAEGPGQDSAGNGSAMSARDNSAELAAVIASKAATPPTSESSAAQPQPPSPSEAQPGTVISDAGALQLAVQPDGASQPAQTQPQGSPGFAAAQQPLPSPKPQPVEDAEPSQTQQQGPDADVQPLREPKLAAPPALEVGIDERVRVRLRVVQRICRASGLAPVAPTAVQACSPGHPTASSCPLTPPSICSNL
jgi:hypothetical protein